MVRIVSDKPLVCRSVQLVGDFWQSKSTWCQGRSARQKVRRLSRKPTMIRSSSQLWRESSGMNGGECRFLFRTYDRLSAFSWRSGCQSQVGTCDQQKSEIKLEILISFKNHQGRDPQGLGWCCKAAHKHQNHISSTKEGMGNCMF